MLVFISCGKAKLDRPAKAKDIYRGGLFRKQRDFCTRMNASYLILSAKYGTLSPETIIDPYEAVLTRTNSYAWGERVKKQLFDLGIDRNQEVISVASEIYTAPLRTYFRSVREPLKGLGLGKRLRRLGELR